MHKTKMVKIKIKFFWEACPVVGEPERKETFFCGRKERNLFQFQKFVFGRIHADKMVVNAING